MAEVSTVYDFMEAAAEAFDRRDLSVIVAKVEASALTTLAWISSCRRMRFALSGLSVSRRSEPQANLHRIMEDAMSTPVTVLSLLVEELNNGRIKVVDLTQPLGPDTPVIDLPPIFAPSPPLSVELISRYDDKGPAWYWNTLHLGEHTGTHFDAPVHWITGKDRVNNTTDTIPVRQFIGPACVIDVSQEVAQFPDFLLTRDHVQAWEGQQGKIPAGAWVLLRSDWSKRQSPRRLPQCQRGWPPFAGLDGRLSALFGQRAQCARRRRRNRRYGCGSGGRL